MDKPKPYIAYTVSFTLPGPPGSFSTFRVECTYGRPLASEDDDLDIYTEAKFRAIEKIPDAQKELLRQLQEVMDFYKKLERKD